MKYKKGDRVAVYAMERWHGRPGFLKGHYGTVRQDQQSGGSVLVRLDEYSIPAGPVTGDTLDIEVYEQQVRRLKGRRRRTWMIRGLVHKGPLISCQKQNDIVFSGPDLADGETVMVREVLK